MHKFKYKGKQVCVSTDFDNGALAKVEEQELNVFDCWPYVDDEYKEGVISLPNIRGSGNQRDAANFCFLFRLDGCRNRKITLRFHVIRERCEEGKISVVYANPDFPVFSYDGKQWERIANKRLSGGQGITDEKIVCVEQTFTKDRVWITYQYPFTNDHLSEFIKGIEGLPCCKVEVAGRSTEGRDIRQISITDPKIVLKDKKVAWFTGLQHCAESGAGWGLEGMIEFLLSKDAIAAEARQRYEFKIISLVNVDAVAEGRGRIHSSGKNLNREWEKPDPVCDIGTIRDTLNNWQKHGNPVDIFMDFHGFSPKDGYWTVDGPVMPNGTGGDTVLREKCRRLVKTLEKQFSNMQFDGEEQSLGRAAGAACRRYNAISFTLDGYLYKRPSNNVVPDLSVYYISNSRSNSRIWELNEIKAAGKLFILALLEYAHSP